MITIKTPLKMFLFREYSTSKMLVGVLTFRVVGGSEKNKLDYFNNLIYFYILI
jgi:hypothetical protein